MSSVVQSRYSSALTTNSQTYSRDCVKSNYYYEARQAKVIEDGYYTFGIRSDISIVGYIYKDSFNPLNPFINLMPQKNFGCDNMRLKLIPYFQADTVYILVITTLNPNVTGKLDVDVFGPKNVSLTISSEYLYYFVISLSTS
jgi:hypothetical protein